MKKNNCPFCGFVATIPSSFVDIRTQHLIYQVECMNCGSKGPKMGSQKASYEAWNKGDFGYRELKANPPQPADDE